VSGPALVIVCGAPGTGKTTLARHLARTLQARLLTKDELKEALADELGAGDLARSRELGRMAYDALYARARGAIASGESVIVEANFHRAVSDPPLRALASIALARVIECTCEADLRRRRFSERGARGERHPVHLDGEILANEWTDDPREFAIDIGVPRLRVDTTSGYAPPIHEIEAFARG
jgi:predicted kinase